MIWQSILATIPLITTAQEGAAPPAIEPSAPAVLDPNGATVTDRTTADEWRERELELLGRIDGLQQELREAQVRAYERQDEWVTYMHVLGSFDLPSLPEPPAFLAEALETPPDPLAEAQAREDARLARRAAEMRVDLEALLIADGVRTLDVLEIGRLHQHEGEMATGPLVARILDARGRMIGMLKAEHMRLETSRSSRSVTIVLEDGYESRRGLAVPFEGGSFAAADAGNSDSGNPGSGILGSEMVPGGGTRRIFLGSMDPKPWIESLPELVDARSLLPVVDDGLWDVNAVRVRLIRLLRESADAGDASWRLAGLTGVRDGELQDVQFVENNGSTGSERHVFADIGRIRVANGGRGIEITLESGSVRRGDRVAPFLGGRYRILLPLADANSWRAARIPGLGVPREDPPQ